MFQKPLTHLISFILFVGITFAYAETDLDALLDEVSKYEYGKSRESLSDLNKKIVESLNLGTQEEMEQKLIDVLNSDATLAAKEFICSEISAFGSEKAVPSLIKLLGNENTFNMALYALHRMSAQNVNQQLRLQLPKTKGNKHIAIINTLGERQDSKAVESLAENLKSSDSKLIIATASALGKIAGDEAVSALKNAIPKTAADTQPVLLDAYLSCADQYTNEPQKAQAIYSDVLESKYPVYLRSAALVGMVKTSGKESLKTLHRTLKEEKGPMQSMAISLIRELPAGTDLSSLTAEFSVLTLLLKIQMLAALTDRKEASGRELAIQVLDDKNQSLRLAALNTLAILGNENDILLLAGIAAKSKGVEKESARKSLGQLKGQNIDQLILSKIPESDTSIKVELIHSIGQRNIKDSSDLLFETIASEQNEVRKESYQSLSIVADENDFHKIIELVVNPEDKTNAQRNRSLAAKVATKYAKSDVPVTLISDRLTTINDLEIKSALLNILGKTGNEKALLVLRNSMQDNNEQVKSAAIGALALWPDAKPLNDLYAIVQKGESEKDRLAALRGYIRIITADDNIDWDEKVSYYEKAMNYADKSNEQRMIIRGLARIETVRSLDLLRSYLDREELSLNAQLAILYMAPETAQADPEKTKAALKHILDITSNDENRHEAQIMLDQL